MQMQQIHDIVKNKWFAGTIFTLITVAFMLWGVTFYLHPAGNGKNAVATVNGKDVSAQQLNRVYNSLVQKNPKYRFASPAQAKQLKSVALQSLVIQKIILQQAKKLGLSVSPAQVNQLIMQMPVFQESGQFSQKRFQLFLYSSGQNMQQFVQQLQHLLLVNQLSNFFQFSSFALPDEKARAYQLVNQARNFAYTVIPVKRFMGKVKVTDAAIKNYYQQNQAQYKTPARVKIAYIQLSPKTLLSKIHVSDKMAKQYYESNLGNYRTPEQWTVETINATGATAQTKMAKIVAELKKGTNFNTLYKANGGTKQSLNAAQLTDKELAVLRSLKPGQLSQPVKGKDGMRLYHLLSVKASKTKAFDDVKSEVIRMLTQQKANDQLSKLNSQLSNITYTNPDSLKPAAKELDTSIQTSDWFTQAGAKQGLASNTKVVNAAFSNDVLNQSNNSNPITLKDGSVVVLRIAKHEPSKVLPLKTVEAKIHAHLQQQFAQAQAAILANKVVAGLRNKKSFVALTKENHLLLSRAEDIKHGDKKVPENIVSQAFQLALPDHPVTTAALPNGDSVVIELKGVKLASYSAAPAKQKQAIERNLEMEQARLTGRLYVNILHRAAKIKVLDKNLQ